MSEHPQCFIGYSWDSPEHSEWVKTLAMRLRDSGVNAVLDQFYLHPGADLSKFMEASIRDSRFVLLVCTPSFADKANSGVGGGGYEKKIITGEVLTNEGHETKFVPLLRAGDPKEALPSYLKNRIFVDFRDNTKFESNLEVLVRLIHEEPLNSPPPIGPECNPPSSSDLSRSKFSIYRQDDQQWSFKNKSMKDRFDVFLCHNSNDKPEVKKIGDQLKDHGLRPWLDEWELRPGFPWQRLLEGNIEKIEAAAIFVGPSGIGPWQKMELEAYLREFVNRGCPVIPVILKGAPKLPKLPLFLGNLTWVDFRQNEPNPLESLIWGITGERRGSRVTPIGPKLNFGKILPQTVATTVSPTMKSVRPNDESQPAKSPITSPRKKTLSRRTFLLGSLGVGAFSLWGTLAGKLGLGAWIRRGLDKKIQYDISIPPETKELARTLFQIHQHQISILPAASNPNVRDRLIELSLPKQVTNTEQLLQYFSLATVNASVFFQPFFDGPLEEHFADYEQVETLVRANKTKNIIALGTPTSNSLIRSMMSYREYANPHEGHEHLPNDGIRFPILFELRRSAIKSAGNQLDARYRAKTPSGELSAEKIPNWGLVGADGQLLLPATDGEGTLLSDFLVISVIPNLLSPECVEKELPIVCIGGTHSVGTLALKNLLEDEHLLLSLKERLEALGSPIFWQASIRVVLEYKTEKIEKLVIYEVEPVEVNKAVLMKLFDDREARIQLVSATGGLIPKNT